MQTHTLKQHAHTIATVAHNVEGKVLQVLVSLACMFLMFYVYFVGSAVFDAVARKEAQDSIAQMSSRVAELEVEYLKQRDTITLTLAEEMGFGIVAQKNFLERARYLGQAQ